MVFVDYEAKNSSDSQEGKGNKQIFSAIIRNEPGHTVTPVTPISLEHFCIKGLDFVLNHFRSSLWPRTISTKATQGKQVIVNSRYQALTYFKAAGYLDCRICAYHYWRPSIISDFADIKNPIVPDIIMIDLDTHNFNYEHIAIKAALRKILKRIKNLLNLTTPTVIWSGNGYHIYIPINVPIVLEDIKEFINIEHVSTKFLRFAEWYLSSGMSDSAHNSTVSLNNCMLRIPYSYNSKNNAQVRIIKKWDGNRSNISLLVGSFCAYLTDKRLKEEDRRQQLKYNSRNFREMSNKGDIHWIETLLLTPIHDYRKYAIWRILAPYLINVKRLSYEQAYSIIKQWLKQCSNLRRLDFHPDVRIREGLTGASRGYPPVSYQKLRDENIMLYETLYT
ncbi:MAG TPA: DNA primase noncatalytic subunit PriX [Nitrososphaeraceae archaeon]|jgi:hypothetical protein